MILRRFAKALKDQNWTSIAIEFVLLVLGVFLGIQVANWNEERQQVARQSQYLERLRVDFVGIRERINAHFTVYRNGVEGGAYILSLLRDDSVALQHADVDAHYMTRAFDGLMSPRVPPPLPATYVEMRSEGQLSHIRNDKLRDRLADYDRLVGVLEEATRVVDDQYVQLAPVVHRHFTTSIFSDQRDLSGVRTEVKAFDLDGMRGDREFAVAIVLLHGNALNSLSLRQRQLALVESILTLIDVELSR